MNGFDFVVIALVAAGALHGVRYGLLRMATSAIALAAALYIASIYYAVAGNLVEHQFSASPTVGVVIGYVAVFALIYAAIEIVGSTAIRLLHVVHLGWLDRLAGSILGAGLVSVAAGIGVMLLTAVLPPDAQMLKDSRVAPMLVAYNEALVRYIPQQARDAYEANRDKLMRGWISEAEKAATRTGASPAASPSSASTAGIR